MPVHVTHPGAFIEEIPSGVHTIAGTSTSETAFIDYFAKGPVGEAVRITNFPEFESQFGGLNADSEASYGLWQYFLNGGQVAWVVRVEAKEDDVPPESKDESPTGNKWKTTTGAAALKSGLAALDTTAFNILCLPAAAALDTKGMKELVPFAIETCLKNRAFFIIDVPQATSLDELNSSSALATFLENYLGGRSSGMVHSALYFPRLTIPDPLNHNRPRNVGPSGSLAGVYARIDKERGVWKAPAGTEAVLNGVDLVEVLTDAQNGEINPLGVNALRAFPAIGNTSWGARTLDGADATSSDFKYIAVRRLASYIESSVYESTKWAVFEPNDEALWAKLRSSVGAFMAVLAQQGALYGYNVTCDDTTTTPTDIAKGIVNLVVSFAPVDPAEFIVLRIQQLVGRGVS